MFGVRPRRIRSRCFRCFDDRLDRCRWIACRLVRGCVPPCCADGPGFVGTGSSCPAGRAALPRAAEPHWYGGFDPLGYIVMTLGLSALVPTIAVALAFGNVGRRIVRRGAGPDGYPRLPGCGRTVLPPSGRMVGGALSAGLFHDHFDGTDVAGYLIPSQASGCQTAPSGTQVRQKVVTCSNPHRTDGGSAGHRTCPCDVSAGRPSTGTRNKAASGALRDLQR